MAKAYERAGVTAPSSPSAIEAVYRVLIRAQPPAWRRAIVAAAIREVEDLLVSSGPATRDAALDALEVLYQELFRLDARSATEALPVQPSAGDLRRERHP